MDLNEVGGETYMSLNAFHDMGICVVLANANERNGWGAATPSPPFAHMHVVHSVHNKYMTIPEAEQQRVCKFMNAV